MQFAMGFRHKSTVLVLYMLLIKKFHAEDISSTIPEQGSQICNVFLVSGIYGVPNEHLSASSELDDQHAAKYGRINTTFVKGLHRGAWSAKTISNEEFIQVKLKQHSLIQAIQTQGRNITGDNPDYAQYVTCYKVSYSTDEKKWFFVNNHTGNQKLFPGNIDQNSIKINQLECPIEARYIRIHTWMFNVHPSMRFDLVGCLLTEENSATDCDFEDGLCGWTQETGNDLLYWTRQNYTRTEEPSIPAEFPELCADNCSFLVLTTQNYSNSNITLRSTNLIQFIPRSSTPRCLRLWSSVVNITSAYINLTVVGCLNQSAMVSSKIVNVSEHGWTPVAVDVRNTDFKLSINGGWTAGDQGYLAVHHTSLITGVCPDCDFENDLCNWNNNGIVNWNLTTDGSKKFISSEVSHNGTGLARLIGPVINVSQSNMFQTCLRFSYSIQGAANNTLRVFLNISGLKSLLWYWAGSSQGWIPQYINILNGSDFQIEFEGKVENGTVNVDDILVLYKTCPELPTTTSAPVTTTLTVTPGSNERKRIDYDQADYIRVYFGFGAGFFTLLAALVIAMICVIRRKRRTTHSKIGVIQPDEVKEANNLEEVEYSAVIKKSDTVTADKIETDFGQIYENQCKPEAYQINNHSTPEADQTYDHITVDEKQPNLNDATYDHATFGKELYGQNDNMLSVLPNASLYQMGDGDGGNEETYSNVPVCRK